MSIKGQASQTHTNMVAHLHAKNISDLKGQCIVFFSKPGAAAKAAGTATITEKEVSEIFQSSLDEKLITGAALEVVTFREANLNEFRNVIVAGLGADKSRSNEYPFSINNGHAIFIYKIM